MRGRVADVPLLASRPAPTPAATNIIARNSSPLPMNTVEKNLSS